MSMLQEMRTLQADAGHEYPIYTPTDFLRRLNRFFGAVRFMHDDNFADFVSPHRDEQVDYAYGVVFVSTMMAVIIFCWVLVLFMLKCRGEAGCASGKPFQTLSDPAQEAGWISNGHTDSGEFDLSLESNDQEQESGGGSTMTDPSFRADNTVRYKRRATSTRIVFLIFGMGVIASSVLFLVFSFASIKESIDASDRTMLATQEIIDQVASSVRTVDAAGAHTSELVANINFDFQSICPNTTYDREVLGINLEDFAKKANDEYDGLKKILSEYLTPINRTLNNVQEIKDRVEIGLEQAQTYSWAFPAVLLGTTIVTTIAMLGVVLAMRGRIGKRLQNCMTYGVLPLLMAFCLVSWLGTISAGVGAMSSGDACIASGQLYGPDSTVADILDRHNLDHNSTTYKMVYAYTNACRISNPTQELVDLEEKLQSSANSIWLEISQIDSIGRTNISEACGNNNLDEFLDGTRQLAKSLSTIRKAIDSTIRTLECKNINPIYVEAIHDGVCGDVANGLGIAFILLLALSICLMVLITLRASWLHQRDLDFDEKMYHENNVADNMIVDEHEEYLAYISRYKHEWEDYEGITSGNVDAGEEEVEAAAEEVADIQVTESEDISYTESYFLEGESEYEPSLAQSSLPDDLSFPSLQVTPSNIAAAVGIMAIAALLPRAYSDEEEQEMQLVDVIASDMPTRRGEELVCVMPIPMNILASNLVEGDIDVDADAKTTDDSKGQTGLQGAEERHKNIDNSKEETNDEIEIGLSASNNLPSHTGKRPPVGRRLPSADDDSIMDQIMKDFCSSSEKSSHEEDMAMHYGANLRTKESIEAGLAIFHDSSDDQHEFRDDDDNESRDPPPPPPSAPTEDVFVREPYQQASTKQEHEAAGLSTCSTNVAKVSKMVDKFNQLYHI